MAKKSQAKKSDIASHLSRDTNNSVLIRYLREYLRERIDLNDFERKVTDQMAAYEETEQRKRKVILERADQPDEEGFITVVSKRPKVFEGEQVPAKKSSQSDTPSTKLLPNLYRVTGITREEERKKQLEDLRRTFEEDKQKLAKLKESNIFKPL